MRPEKIYIITDAPIPIGFAPTSRILSYVSGFEKNGVDCEVVVFRKTETPGQVQNNKTKGKIGKSNYWYLFKSTVKSTLFIKRRIDNIFGLINLFWFALVNIKNNNVIIYYSSYSRYAFALKTVKIFKGYILLKEESETPVVYKNSKNRVSYFIFQNIHYRLFDGFLLMTQSLLHSFNNLYPNKKKILVPMTVDVHRFIQQIDFEIKEKKVITYIGSLNNKKDGILILLKAFNILIKEYSCCKLLICGYTSSPQELVEFKNHIKLNKLETKVEFRSNVNSTEIPELLNQSDILVLPRPDSIQAKNSFPTKLGEYLASGKPTVVTSVGEIPNYLKDEESTFIVKPGDVNSLVKKLRFVLDNEESAMKVGKNGREVALTFFNNIIQTKKIIKFLEN